MDKGMWEDRDANIVIWTDASLHSALAFMMAGNGWVYKLSEPPPGVRIDIFFLELCAILSAITHVAAFDSPPRKLLIWSDSLDSLGTLSSLQVKESLHNGPLLGVASLILKSGIDLHLRHIPGKLNVGADLLSCLAFDVFAIAFPSYCVRTFEPSQGLLPTQWREVF
jgi:hypothetical protein